MTKTRQWSVLTAVAVLVVLAAGWLLLVKPERSKVTDAHAQVTTEQQASQRLQTQITALESEQRSLPQWQQKLQQFSTQVPNDPAEPTLIQQLSTAAKASGVDLVSLTPGTATPVTASTATGSTTLTAPAAGSGSLTALPVAVAISGTYPNIESFFQSLEKLPRALLVSGWNLAPANAPTTSGSGGPAGATPAIGSTDPNALTGTLSTVVYYSGAPATATAPAGATATTPSTTSTGSPAASASTPAK